MCVTGLVSRNPAALMPLPTGSTKTHERKYTQDEVNHVFAEMLKDKHAALWLIMLALGE